LQVFYLDNVYFGQLNDNRKLTPRYKYFPWDIVKNMLHEDKIDSGLGGITEFGRAKVRKIDLLIKHDFKRLQTKLLTRT
jgi:hypothetical protein